MQEYLEVGIFLVEMALKVKNIYIILFGKEAKLCSIV